jgi:glycosyltransferase involved in cell wall biosynthesis
MPSHKGLARPRQILAQPHMRLQGHIIFIGDFLFPDGDAAAIRTLSLARICRDLGFSVTVIGKGQVRAEDYDAQMAGYYLEGIRYSTMNPTAVTSLQRLRHPISRLRLYVSALESLTLDDTRAVIINASGSAMHIPLVSAFCRRRSIPLIGDVCEWYDPCQMNYGRLNPLYVVFWLIFRYSLPRFRNLIVVSTLLERHFEGKGRNVTRIPPVVDPYTIQCLDRAPTNRLLLLYAGLPGRKDRLREMIVALASLAPHERSRIEFRLLGPTKQELITLLGRSAHLLTLLGDTVKPLGRVPRDQVLEALQEAHFTVLLRPDKRYAHAGFPSKVPESLAAGAPVLLNFTSDLREYLGDGTAALQVHDCSPVEVAKALQRALQLRPATLLGLRRGARLKAEQCFDYRLYLKPFTGLIERLR